MAEMTLVPGRDVREGVRHTDTSELFDRSFYQQAKEQEEEVVEFTCLLMLFCVTLQCIQFISSRRTKDTPDIIQRLAVKYMVINRFIRI